MLTDLFQNLPKTVKKNLNENTKVFEPKYEVDKGLSFKDHLIKINIAFEKWRYIYEARSEYMHIPTVILVLNVLHQTTADQLKINT